MPLLGAGCASTHAHGAQCFSTKTSLSKGSQESDLHELYRSLLKRQKYIRNEGTD